MKHSIRSLIALSASVCLLLGGFSLSACDKEECAEHSYGIWQVREPATCTEAGVRFRACTVCGREQEEPILPPGHDWGVWKITSSADCVNGGKRSHTCSVCLLTESEDTPALGHAWGDPIIIDEPDCTNKGSGQFFCDVCGTDEILSIPALGHDFVGGKIIEPAGCGKEGKREASCSLCGTTTEWTIPARSHFWVEDEGNVPATCTEAGYRNVHCKYCNQPDKAEIPALGHVWSGEYTVDKHPTFTADGEKSLRCLRCGEHGDPVAIPKLQEGVKIPYSFRIMRNNGTMLPDTSAVITVKDGNGTTVATSTYSQIVNGVYTVELLPKTYTVTVSGLPKGFTAQESYEALPGETDYNLYVTASLLGGEPSSDTRYSVGSVMHDFTYTTVRNETVSLSALLAEKDLVVINFWATWCTPCQNEFPYLQAAYEQYSDSVAVIAVDADRTGETETPSMLRSFANQFGLTFYVTAYTGLYHMIDGTGNQIPATIFIDKEGVICDFLGKAASSVSEFTTRFEKYTSDEYWQHSPAENLSGEGREYALPPKREV